MIPIVFISDENFIMQTHIVIKSLIATKNPGTKYDIFVVMAECSIQKQQELKVLETNDVKINFIEASLDEFKDIKQLAHIPIACLLKFKICDFVVKYDKIIYLDGDIIVRGDLSLLYQINVENYYAGAVQALENIHNGEKRYNAGVMLFNAKRMREEKMSDKLIAARKKLGDRGSMDQQTFNLLLSDQMRDIPCKYNCIAYKIIGGEKKNFKIENLNKLYNENYVSNKEMVDDAVIIHYATGGKPWRYTYIPCSKEWFAYYKTSIYKTVKIKRDNRFSAHYKGFKRVMKSSGIRGIIKKIKEYLTGGNSDIANHWG